MALAVRLTNAQRKRVHLRRDRPSIEWRTVVANEPLADDALADVRGACKEHGADVVMDSWLSLGLDRALEQLNGWLGVTGIWNQRVVVGLARRLRERIATADDDTYASAVDQIAGWRSTPLQSAVAAYLVPSEPALAVKLADAVDRSELLWLLLCLDEPGQLSHIETLASYQRFDVFAEDAPATLADAMGADLLPYLYSWLSMNVGSGPVEKHLIGLAMAQQTHEAWLAVVPRVGGATGRDVFKRGFAKSPELAASAFLPRLAAGDAIATKHRYLAEQFIHDHSDLVNKALGSYDDKTRALVAEIRAAKPESEPDGAAVGDIPALLAAPPWENRTKSSKRRTVADVDPIETEPAMRWMDGERESWLGRPWTRELPDPADWDRLDSADRRRLLHHGEVDVMQVHARAFSSLNLYDKDLAARFELDLSPGVREFVLRRKQGWETPAWAIVVPFGLPDLAAPIVEVYGKGTRASRFAKSWLQRHDELAAAHLIPRVVSPERKGRSVADVALRMLARHNEAIIRTVATRYGDEVTAAIDQFLAVDPLDVLPARIPSPPSYVRTNELEAPVLCSTDEPLPPSAVENIVIMLALSKEAEYAGVEQVQLLCEPDSLAAFALSLYRSWTTAGSVRKDVWLTSAIDLFGNDSIVGEISGQPRKKDGTPDAVRQAQIDLLGRIGTDAALASLFHISTVIPRKVTARDARKKVQEMAEIRGLSTDELADRLIRTFDLDDQASMELDFGPRLFSVVFDETLTPVVRTSDGEIRKALPKANNDDDAAMAAEAHQRFKHLKRDVRDTASEQIKRFEQAMVLGRRWTWSDAERFFADHPLMKHLVRRLVWGTYASTDAGAELIDSFRIAEDGSFANALDENTEVSADAIVGVAHPVELGDTGAWAQVFGDYELGQPFEQIGRSAYTVDALPDGIDLDGGLLLAGNPMVPHQRILGLTSRGWDNEHIGSSTGNFSRELRSGRVGLSLSPGFSWGTGFEEQQIGVITVPADPSGVDASELIRDLVWLGRPA